MISYLSIKNFQSHKNTLLEFSSGVNVIVGKSDCGKTAIIRALRFVTENKPGGDAFRSHWGGDTEVEIGLGTGESITRKKANTENAYILNGDTDHIFKAFGQGVPEEVSVLMNMNEVNLQQQHDSSFLISQSAGEVANHFNRIANIEIINKSLTKAKKVVADTKQTISQAEEDLKEKRELHKQYKNLPEIAKKIKYLERWADEKVKQEATFKEITKKLERLSEIEVESAKIKQITKLEPAVNSLLEKEKERFENQNQSYKLRALLKKISVNQKELDESQQKVKLEPLVQKIISKSQMKATFLAQQAQLTTLVNKYTKINKKWQETNEKWQELEVALPEVCPVCEGTGKLKTA